VSSEVVAQIETQVAELRASGGVPPELEEELDARFDEISDAILAPGGPKVSGDAWIVPDSAGGQGSPIHRLAQFPSKTATMARQRFGPSLRVLERRTALGAGRAAEATSTQYHVIADQLERIAARSPLASRALSAARVSGPGPSAGESPAISGPLLDWVLERLAATASLGDAEAAGLVLHAECGDGRVVEVLAARGHDARGADPQRSARAGGDTNIVAAGALEYLAATPSDSLNGLLLTGVVDRLRPGAARALAHLAARRLAPGGVVVLVSMRPEVAVAMDPVAADLASGRPVHPVTWCHLLARYGLSELAVFEPDASEPDVFAVSAQRPVASWLSAKD